MPVQVLDDSEVRRPPAEPIVAPDVLIVQDPTLLHQVDVFQGLQAEGYVLINSSRSIAELGLRDFLAHYRQERLLTVPATELALKHFGRPLPTETEQYVRFAYSGIDVAVIKEAMATLGKFLA